MSKAWSFGRQREGGRLRVQLLSVGMQFENDPDHYLAGTDGSNTGGD